MNKAVAVGVGLILLVLLVLFSTTFTVKYNEVAVKATFGETGEGSVVREPGLHYRLPVFVDKVTKLDTRLQLVESPLEEITTVDGLQVVVKAYLLWRVEEEGDAPRAFFKAYESVDAAAQALRNQFRAAVAGTMSGYSFSNLLGEESRLAAAEEEVLARLAEEVGPKGVEPVAVGISQLVLPPKTSTAVLTRMQATRDVLAEGERNAGTAEAERIRSEGATLADKIRAFADQRAEEVRAQGEREAGRYLAQMREDEDLALFLVWLNTLERALSKNTMVMLPARGGLAPFHLMDLQGAAFRNAIPMPAGEEAIATLDAPPAGDGGDGDEPGGGRPEAESAGGGGGP